MKASEFIAEIQQTLASAGKDDCEIRFRGMAIHDGKPDAYWCHAPDILLEVDEAGGIPFVGVYA